MKTLPAFETMYEALLQRDASFDGLFIACVKTTGIFCRPTCTARKPKAENVEFLPAARDALHAGYRPCKVCRPMDNGHAPPEWVERLMQEVERSPDDRISDARLRAISIEPSRARRYFQKHYGMTFHAYHRARRLGRALTSVRNGAKPGDAGYNAGFESESGFREAFGKLFGATPGQARDATCLMAKWIDTPLGAMLAVADDEGLRLLEFVDRRAIEAQVNRLRRRLKCTIVPGEHAHLTQTEREIGEYFDGSRTSFDVPLAMCGSDFQLTVWEQLRLIPSGETKSYAQMAEDLGRPGAHRAIGRANGDNAIAIIVPCHRVVASDGTLCGYGGGLWRKKWLLEHEQSPVSDADDQQSARSTPVSLVRACAATG